SSRPNRVCRYRLELVLRLPDFLNRAIVLGPFLAIGSKRDELAGLEIHCSRQRVAIRPHVRTDVAVVGQLFQLAVARGPLVRSRGAPVDLAATESMVEVLALHRAVIEMEPQGLAVKWIGSRFALHAHRQPPSHYLHR